MASRSDAAPVAVSAPATTVAGHLIIQLPDDASAHLPSRGQVAVTGTADGTPFDAVIEPDGRRGHWVRVADLGAASVGIADGSTVALEIAPAAAWPEPVVPSDLRVALDDAPDLADTWKSITPMARWEWVRWVQATRNPATRERRVEVSISKLRDGKRRPCCFDLAACTDPELAKSGKLVEV